MTTKHQGIKFIICLILLLTGSKSKAYTQDTNTKQLFRQVLHQPYHKRFNALKKIYSQVVALPGPTAYTHIDSLTSIAENAGDEALALEMQLLRAYYDIVNDKKPIDDAIKAVQAVADKAAKKHLWAVQVRALDEITEAWWKHQQYERMFRAFLSLEKLISSPPTSSTPKATLIKLTGSIYSDIAEAYFYFRNYDKAIGYLKKALALPLTDYNVFEKVRTWNNFGLCYKKMEEFKKSSYYLKKVINFQPQSALNPLWIAIAGGNLGYNYYRMGRLNEAIPLLKKDINVSAKKGIYGEAGIATINLIKVRLKQSRLQQAGTLIPQAQVYMDKATKDDKLHFMYQLYTVISKWHAAMGHSQKASLYIDSMRSALKAHNRNFSLLKLMRAHQKINYQRRQTLLTKKQQQLQQRNMAIGFVLLLFLGSLAAYIFRNRYLQRKQEIKDLQLKSTSKKLEYARSQINRFTQRVKRNNKVIARLKQEENHPEYTDILREIKSSSLLTDDDWVKFKKLFDQVYPGYIDRLKEMYPELTPTQIRFMVLVKLKFSRKEMANILGISPQSLRVTWYRIRKNLNMPKETNATQLAEKI